MTALVVPDQLKSAVTQPCRYEPEIQRTFEEWAEHYGTVVLPARPRQPRDKAKVEVGVLVAQRWILARLRNQSFFSLARAQRPHRRARSRISTRASMRRYGKSRRELFDALDRPALKPLPAQRFEVYAEWSKVKVNIDYHVEVEHHYYSVPHTLVGTNSWRRASPASTVELFATGERVAAHRPQPDARRHSPPSRRTCRTPISKHLEWSPARHDRLGGQQIGP